jgi:hypothetical protein
LTTRFLAKVRVSFGFDNQYTKNFGTSASIGGKFMGLNFKHTNFF